MIHAKTLAVLVALCSLCYIASYFINGDDWKKSCPPFLIGALDNLDNITILFTVISVAYSIIILTAL